MDSILMAKTIVDAVLNRKWDDDNIDELPPQFASLLAMLIDVGAYDDADDLATLCDSIFMVYMIIQRHFEIPNTYGLRVLERFQTTAGNRREMWMALMMNCPQEEIIEHLASLMENSPSEYIALAGVWLRPMLRVQSMLEDSEKDDLAEIIREKYEMFDEDNRAELLSRIEHCRANVAPNDFSIYKFIPDVNLDSSNISH